MEAKEINNQRFFLIYHMLNSNKNKRSIFSKEKIRKTELTNLDGTYAYGTLLSSHAIGM